MIVNCFNAVRVIDVRFHKMENGERVKYANQASIRRVHQSIVETFGLDSEASADAFIMLVQGGSPSMESTYLTPAETRLIDTIVRWWSAELGDEYEDGWGMKSLVTPNFVFENHNRAVGIILHRKGKK